MFFDHFKEGCSLMLLMNRDVARLPTVGYKRSMLEALPEVLDEENGKVS
jgi:hypothetical protein